MIQCRMYITEIVIAIKGRTYFIDTSAFKLVHSTKESIIGCACPIRVIAISITENMALSCYAKSFDLYDREK